MRRRLIRLPRHSIFGWDKFPICKEEFFVHETMTNSTTSVINLQRDKFPISQEDFLVHDTTIDRLLRYSLSLKKIFLIHETTIDRLLRYSAFGGTSSLSPKRISSSIRRQLIDYFSTRPSEGQVPYLSRRFFSSMR